MKQKNKGWIAAFCLAAALIGLMCALSMSLASLPMNSISEDPAAISGLMRGTVDYRLPQGYGQMYFGLPFLLKGVMIGPRENQNGFSIVIVQSPFLNASNGEAFVRGLHSRYKSNTMDVNWRAAGTTPVLINGRFVSMTVNEGNNSSGCAYRSLSVELKGASGPVILAVTGLANQWDAGAFDALVRSIKY